jgi:hypothetical protein
MRYCPDMGHVGIRETKKPEIRVAGLKVMNLGSAE